MPITYDIRQRALQYNRELFAPEDDHLRRLEDAAREAGLPQIQISSDVGRLLQILIESIGGKRALELGTLGGYSGTWIARALGTGGRLITLETEPKHKAFAEHWFNEAGLADRVEVRREPALEALPRMRDEKPFDFIFIDAIKAEYPDYFRLARPLLRPGGILTADNTLLLDDRDVSDPDFDDASARGIREFNRLLANDPDFVSIIVPLRAGVAVGLKRGV